MSSAAQQQRTRAVDDAGHAKTSPTAAVALADRLRESRALSLRLAAPLSDEDQTVQSCDDASPTKWHLAHTTWFYEAFVLRPNAAGYEPYSDAFDYCFNSYYETAGERHPRARRGHLTRPSAAEVHEYRAHIDRALTRLCASDAGLRPEVADLIELGINHEQQHQELLLMDILSLFACNPLHPAYRVPAQSAYGECSSGGTGHTKPDTLAWLPYDGGITNIGHGGASFSYDNETPRHRTLLHPFRLADRLVTNGEWLEFIAAGAYRDPLLWLADGWAKVKGECWQAPGYWEFVDGAWHQMTLAGRVRVDPAAPVCHVSYFEADAYARWAGRRLPTEFEWEHAAAIAMPQGATVNANTLGTNSLRPLPAPPTTTVASPFAVTTSGHAARSQAAPRQMLGDVWQWTSSAYLAYPGYRPPPGAIGEYNGKFMISQHVLRGASFATPDGHSRPTYRNFFYPHQRWQFSGVRLAEDM